MRDAVDELIELFARFGESRYDERVTLTAHSEQTAACAVAAGAPDPLVAAALLHDIGHLLLARERGDEDFLRTDWTHDAVAAHWLRPRFGDAVADPVGLHVAAKRWLCANEPGYANRLSPASVASLEVQGGPYGPAESDAFLATPGAAEAVQLRGWDDDGKIAGLDVEPIESYGPLLRSLAETAS